MTGIIDSLKIFCTSKLFDGTPGMKFSSGLEQNLKTEFLHWYKGEHGPSSTTVWWVVACVTQPGPSSPAAAALCSPVMLSRAGPSLQSTHYTPAARKLLSGVLAAHPSWATSYQAPVQSFRAVGQPSQACSAAM